MSEKDDGAYIYVMGKEGELHTEPAYKYFPRKQKSFWEKIKAFVLRKRMETK